MTILTSNVLAEVRKEREHQDAQWGEQNYSPFMALAILMEEVGEAAQAAVQDNEPGGESWDYRKELIHVAAVAVRMVETFDRRMSLPFGGGSDSTKNDPGIEIQRLMLEINFKNAEVRHLDARLVTAINQDSEMKSVVKEL